jgi:IclR family acetate operon transcriptional repressor
MAVIVQSVSRALRLLDILADHPHGLGLAEIARRSGLNVSTTHHLLHTLFVDHYVARLANGAYCLGHAVSRLYSAYAVAQQPDGRLLKVLSDLVTATQETSYLVGWQEENVVIQAIVEGSQQLRIGGLRVGYYGHTHARAAGKALLAYRDDEHIRRFLEKATLDRLTPHTLCDPQALRAELQQIAAQGFALDREEFTEGVGCVAAPIFAADGQAVAALSLSAPAWRLQQHMATLAAAVKQSAREASAILGHAAHSANGQAAAGASAQ